MRRGIITLAVAAVGASAVIASPVYLDFVGPASYAGTANITFTNTLLNPNQVTTGNYHAGAMNLRVGPNQSNLLNTLGYCVDFTRTAGDGGAILTNTNSLSPRGNQIAFLINSFAQGFHAAANVSGSTALQLAIWELLYDNDPFSLSTGNFKVNSVGGGANMTQVNTHFTTFMSALSNSSNQSAINGAVATYINGTGSNIQSFVIPSTSLQPVPEPFTMALGGAAAAAFIRKRRQAKKA